MVERPADVHGKSDRLPTRREVLGMLGTVTGLGLAGCSGGGDGVQTESSTPEPTPTETTEASTETTEVSTETPTETTEAPSREQTTTSGSGSEYTKEKIGEVEENTTGGLEIAGWTSTVNSGDSTFSVEMILRNTGDQATEPAEYTYRITPYDDDGSELAVTARSLRSETLTLEPGETSSVTASIQVDDPRAVASYGIVLTCEMLDTGVYCN
ncbi:hypothetical protein [Haloarcula halophila]|uniref:hypothetical protein n=1 Tax=Haloarcula TaxID=2237 RepID=UPI0023E4470A|nr:hypothetical protein [Halomicroarcula sp. DFY41]